MLRGSGVAWDLQRNQPMNAMTSWNSTFRSGVHGDCYDRYLCRVEEMRQSIRCASVLIG